MFGDPRTRSIATRLFISATGPQRLDSPDRRPDPDRRLPHLGGSRLRRAPRRLPARARRRSRQQPDRRRGQARRAGIGPTRRPAVRADLLRLVLADHPPGWPEARHPVLALAVCRAAAAARRQRRAGRDRRLAARLCQGPGRPAAADRRADHRYRRAGRLSRPGRGDDGRDRGPDDAVRDRSHHHLRDPGGDAGRLLRPAAALWACSRCAACRKA